MPALRGVETFAVRVRGSVEAAALAARLPAPIEPDEAAGRAAVDCTFLRLRDLGLGRLPPRFDYDEALLRAAVRVAGARAFFVLRCFIDRRLPAFFASSLVRYPV